jgi:hypothetical protein
MPLEIRMTRVVETGGSENAISTTDQTKALDTTIEILLSDRDERSDPRLFSSPEDAHLGRETLGSEWVQFRLRLALDGDILFPAIQRQAIREVIDRLKEADKALDAKWGRA